MDLQKLDQRLSAILSVFIVNGYIDIQPRIDKESSRRFTPGVGKQKSSTMTNFPANLSLRIQLIMDWCPGSEMWGFLPPLLCEHVCHSQPYFHSFDRKERSRERFSMFSIRKAHATSQPAGGHEDQEKLRLNAGPNPSIRHELMPVLSIRGLFLRLLGPQFYLITLPRQSADM